MTREQIIEMLKDVVEEIDYDVYKEMFVPEDEDDAIGCDALIAIVERHLQ